MRLVGSAPLQGSRRSSGASGYPAIHLGGGAWRCHSGAVGRNAGTIAIERSSLARVPWLLTADSWTRAAGIAAEPTKRPSKVTIWPGEIVGIDQTTKFARLRASVFGCFLKLQLRVVDHRHLDVSKRNLAGIGDLCCEQNGLPYRDLLAAGDLLQRDGQQLRGGWD